MRATRRVIVPQGYLPPGFTSERRDKRTYTFDAEGKPVCGARNRTGGICKRTPTEGRNRCNLHGGKSLRGMQSPHFVTGRYSKDVFGHLVARYEQAVNDPELLAMRDEIALLQVRIADVLKSLNIGESREIWIDLKKEYDKLRKAIVKGDKSSITDSIVRIGSIIDKANDYHNRWDEVMKAMTVKSQLVDKEQKRLTAMSQMISAEEAMKMMVAVVKVVQENVTDRDTLQAIASSIQQIANQKGLLS